MREQRKIRKKRGREEGTSPSSPTPPPSLFFFSARIFVAPSLQFELLEQATQTTVASKTFA